MKGENNMGKSMLNGECYGSDNANDIVYDNKNSGMSATNTQDAIDELKESLSECFQSVSNGKALVASAITGKGVKTASDAAFATMTNNINKIKDVANNTQATATAADITAGKTAWVNGKLISGTRPLPVNKQSGSVTFMVAAASSSGSKTTDYLVRFTAAFEKVPSVTAAATSLGQHFTVSTFNVTQTSFYIRVVNHTLYGSQEVTFNWVAQSQ